MAETIAFYALSALILGLGVAVITTPNTVHSVLFLVMNFLGVAVIYVVLEAEFLAVIQVLVYAGGIVVLYLFVVMLVNLKREPEAHQDPHRLSLVGLALAGALLTDDEMAREQDWAAYDDPFGDWHEDPCDDFDAADDVNQRHQDDEGH